MDKKVNLDENISKLKQEISKKDDVIKTIEDKCGVGNDSEGKDKRL